MCIGTHWIKLTVNHKIDYRVVMIYQVIAIELLKTRHDITMLNPTFHLLFMFALILIRAFRPISFALCMT